MSKDVRRYFFEVAYKGTGYCGFQAQLTGETIESVVAHALKVYYKEAISLTCSSRTDAGVHAHKNYFHADTGIEIHQRQVYNLNALLPKDVFLKKIALVAPEAHCRFDARFRCYEYRLTTWRDPFSVETEWHYPFSLNLPDLQWAAKELMAHKDFSSFSKRNTQVKTFLCEIFRSEWHVEKEKLIYRVSANRFLRGMVRALVATMLQVGRGNISKDDFRNIILAKDCTKARFDAPAHGLFLMDVAFPDDVWI